MTTFFERARIAALVAVVGFGCATTGGAGDAGGDEEREISQRAHRLFADAVRAYEEGQKLRVIDWEALARKFEAVLAEDRRYAEAHYNLGVIAERRGDAAAAQAAYEAAIQHQPELAVAHENLGLLFERRGELRRAEERYKALLRVRPDHAGARAHLARLYRKAGDDGRALDVAQEALMRDPTNRHALRVMAEVRLAQGEHEVARLLALRIIQLDESDPDGPMLLAEIWDAQGEAGKAAMELSRAAELDARHLPSRQRLAQRALEARNFEEAARRYQEIVEIEADAAAYLNWSLALLGLGRAGEAEEALQRAEALAPDEPRHLYARALLLHRHLGDAEAALPIYRRFLAEAPFALPAEHPVFEQLRECEQIVFHLQEARALEEAARREEEAARRAAEEQAQAEEGDEGSREVEALPPEEAPAEDEPRRAEAWERDPDEPEDDY